MTTGEILVGEIIGTMILILLGDGVVANVVLNKSKGQDSGWIVITTGWGLGVAMAVYVTGWLSGAHINPAVTIGLFSIGGVTFGQMIIYIIGQMIGAFLGAVLVWLAYLPHWEATDDPGTKLAVFCTAPAIRNLPLNLITETIGTAMLLLGVLALGAEPNNIGAGVGGAFAVGFLVFAIGLSLGGPTGYAINQARDLAPRIAHAILPIPGKGGSDWEYSWVPIVGPTLGGVIGALLWQFVLAPFIG